MALDAETVAEMGRRIEAMHKAAKAGSVNGPYTVFVPKPLFDAFNRLGVSLPFDVKAQPLIETRKEPKFRYGRPR